MTATQAMEYRITRRVMSRRETLGTASRPEDAGSETLARRWPDRLIQVLAVTAGLVVMGSFSQELLWAGLATATVCALAAD